jgi:hypothetical protein
MTDRFLKMDMYKEMALQDIFCQLLLAAAAAIKN